MGTDPNTGQPITTCEWIDRLAPKALAVIGAGTCATYGGIHAMAGNPTGCMGLADYLGWDWRSKAGLADRECARMPRAAGQLHGDRALPAVPGGGTCAHDSARRQLRPTWLFGKTVHEGCDRAAYYEQDDFGIEYGTPKCLVKVGCWGPVVNCNVTKRGWMRGIGGCPNVGGICIGCTMPGFPDMFMPFMDEPSGARFSTAALTLYGKMIRSPARHHKQYRQRRAGVATPRPRTHHRLSTQTRRVLHAPNSQSCISGEDRRDGNNHRTVELKLQARNEIWSR